MVYSQGVYTDIFRGSNIRCAGNLYGATQYGGGYGSCNSPLYQYCGTIFELSPPKTKGGKWTEKVLYSFKSGTDGANPNGGLLFDSKGVIYGTTSSGGDHVCKTDTSVGCGTAYKLTPPEVKGKGWTEREKPELHGRWRKLPRGPDQRRQKMTLQHHKRRGAARRRHFSTCRTEERGPVDRGCPACF